MCRGWPAGSRRRVFPVGAALLGVVGLVGLGIAVAQIADHSLQPSGPADLITGLICDAASLGVALGLSSILSGHRPRALSILG
ncbi:MAG TPA: hypothetical protein VGL99_04130, partial [Chloroflexota bacterium]